MDINEKCRKLPVLRRCEKYLSDRDEKYLYDKKISEWIKIFDELNLYNLDYSDLPQINHKEISQLTRDEVIIKMTFLIRSRHFGNDNFSYAVADGSLENLCHQLHLLIYLEE